jgi:hypothetical protein
MKTSLKLLFWAAANRSWQACRGQLEERLCTIKQVQYDHFFLRNSSSRLYTDYCQFVRSVSWSSPIRKSSARAAFQHCYLFTELERLCLSQSRQKWYV